MNVNEGDAEGDVVDAADVGDDRGGRGIQPLLPQLVKLLISRPSIAMVPLLLVVLLIVVVVMVLMVVVVVVLLLLLLVVVVVLLLMLLMLLLLFLLLLPPLPLPR